VESSSLITPLLPPPPWLHSNLEQNSWLGQISEYQLSTVVYWAERQGLLHTVSESGEGQEAEENQKDPPKEETDPRQEEKI
jgi:hypothetical protein